MRVWMIRLLAAGSVSVLPVATAAAQDVAVKGYGMVGAMSFSASESFDAIFGSSTGTILGGHVYKTGPATEVFRGEWPG
jgi:hypothetical protein